MLKTHDFQDNVATVTQEAQPAAIRRQVRRRQALTILYAVILVSIAGVASAQGPHAIIQYDGLTPIVKPTARAQVEGGVLRRASDADARPRYVQMFADMANFDADPDPDGWRVELMLLDRRDRAVVARSSATFELIPRVSTADYYRYIDADIDPVRWSMPLDFDDDGIARIKLPLRESLQPLFGWPSALFPADRRGRSYGTNPLRSPDRQRWRDWSRRGTVVTAWQETVGMPNVGELSVRVAVPTEGVFRAVTPVRIRPSVLVDTRWPYR